MGYFKVNLRDSYREILKEIKKSDPKYEEASDSKVAEKAIDLLHMQCKGEIIRFTKDDYKKIISMLPEIKESE